MIGQTNTNNPTPVTKTNGIITPRLGNIKIDNIRFYNYPAGTYTLTTCSNCSDVQLFTNTAQEIHISKITFSNVLGYKLYMDGLKR